MKIDILTLFPEMFEGPFGTSMLKRAQEDKKVEIKIHNLRDWAEDNYKTVDDRPYGGGAGMIIRVDIIDKALSALKLETRNSKLETKLKSQISNSKHNKQSTEHRTRIILLSAKGKTYNQRLTQQFSKLDHLVLIAGHYEGVDERVAEHLVDEEISIGDYVLTGGEIPTMVIVDSVVRLIPGVLGNPDSLAEESFSSKYEIRNTKYETEYPQYTRPEVYNGWKVPEILLSGNHKEIENWRKGKSK